MINEAQFTKGVALPASLAANAKATISFANEMLVKFPFLKFTSGYRTAARNKAVGGVPTSLHVQARAVDFVPTDGKYTKDREAAIKEFAATAGFWLLVHDAGSGNHYHLEYNPRKLGKPVKK